MDPGFATDAGSAPRAPGAALPLDRRAAAILLRTALWAGGFWAYHEWLVLDTKGPLRLSFGALRSYHALPLYANWARSLSGWLVPALVVIAGFLFACRALYLAPRPPRALPLLAISWFFFIAIGFSVSMIDAYTLPDGSLFLPFTVAYSQKGLDYFGDVPLVDHWGGPAVFLERFAVRSYYERLSLHAGSHPPGGILLLWAASRLIGRDMALTALASVAFTGVTLLPVWGLARRLYGADVARLALALFLVTPNFVMFTTTSMDGPFSVPLILSVWVFFEIVAMSGGRPWARACGLGLLMAVASLMTYASCLLGLLFGTVTLLLARDRPRFARIAWSLAVALALFALCHLALHVFTGYDAVTALRRAMAHDRGLMGARFQGFEHFVKLGFLNLAAFLLGVGIPQAALWAGEVVRLLRAAGPRGPAEAFLLGSAATLALTAFSTLFTGEVERVWLFMVPLVVVPVARRLAEHGGPDGASVPAYWVLGLLGLQLVTFEVLLNTRW